MASRNRQIWPSSMTTRTGETLMPEGYANPCAFGVINNGEQSPVIQDTDLSTAGHASGNAMSTTHGRLRTWGARRLFTSMCIGYQRLGASCREIGCESE